jgi:DNA-binding HxlR family transcriptional regulator
VAPHRAAPALCEKFHRAVELIGARWSGAILQVLLHGPVRYADLRAAVRDISDRMLCERLRALEEEGIVVRTVSQEPPVRVEYELSAKGRALEPALSAIGRWAAVWLATGEETKDDDRRGKKGTANEEHRSGDRRTKKTRAGHSSRQTKRL